MAFDPFKRYFKLNLAILVAGGLVLSLAAGRGLSEGSGIDPLGQVMGSWVRATATPLEGEARLRAELMAARARVVELQDELYRVGAELQNVSHQSRASEALSSRTRISARVVQARDLSPLRKAFRIDRGASAGIAHGMPVTCLGWLVGVVAQVREHSATVVTVADTTFRADVRIGALIGEVSVPDEREPGRPRGVYVGLGGLGGEGEVLLVAATGRAGVEQVARGSVVYTAGSDTIPAGLPVGLVSEVVGDNEGLFLDIRVTPAFDLHWMELVQVEAAAGALEPRAEIRREREKR